MKFHLKFFDDFSWTYKISDCQYFVEQVIAGHSPSKETLRKVRRRCVRECDDESVHQVESLLQRFKYRLAGENRKEQLFKLEYASEYP